MLLWQLKEARACFGSRLRAQSFLVEGAWWREHGPAGHMAPESEGGRGGLWAWFAFFLLPLCSSRTPACKTGFTKCTGKYVSFCYPKDVIDCVKVIIYPECFGIHQWSDLGLRFYCASFGILMCVCACWWLHMCTVVCGKSLYTEACFSARQVGFLLITWECHIMHLIIFIPEPSPQLLPETPSDPYSLKMLSSLSPHRSNTLRENWPFFPWIHQLSIAAQLGLAAYRLPLLPSVMECGPDWSVVLRGQHRCEFMSAAMLSCPEDTDIKCACMLKLEVDVDFFLNHFLPSFLKPNLLMSLELTQ